MKIFFSSVGRRVALLQLFKKEFENVSIIGGDYRLTSPALFHCDKIYSLPLNINEEYIEKILNICIQEKVDIAIPMIDPELELYSLYKEKFLSNGIDVMISDSKSIDISLDKQKTFDFFNRYNFVQLPYTSLLKDFNRNNFSTDYVLLKPRKGSSSQGIVKLDIDKVCAYADIFGLDSNDYIVQECIDTFYEVTIDVFLSKQNELIELCQRRRLKVRNGEVEQAVTIKDKHIAKIVGHIVHLIPFTGIINIQILVSNDQYYLCEINPRFGGGFPLSYHSGANMIELIRDEWEKKKLHPYFDQRYQEGFYMLRYDDAIYTDQLREADG